MSSDPPANMRKLDDQTCDSPGLLAQLRPGEGMYWTTESSPDDGPDITTWYAEPTA